MNNDIAVLGCSFSSGYELYDPYIIDDYENLIMDKNKKTNDFITQCSNFYMTKIMNCISHDEYVEKCKELAWPAKLHNIINRNIENYAIPGIGLSYYKNVVQHDPKDIITDHHTKIQELLKNDIYMSDILIWQLTFEPRYCLKFEKYFSCDVLKDSALKNINKYEKIPKWKRKIFEEYHRYCLSEFEYFKDNLLFFENVLLQRAANKKHTVIFSFREAFVNREFKEKSIGYPIIENEYIHYRNNPNDGGILDEYFGKEVYTHQMLFGHPDEYTHKRVAEDMKNYMKEKGII